MFIWEPGIFSLPLPLLPLLLPAAILIFFLGSGHFVLTIKLDFILGFSRTLYSPSYSCIYPLFSILSLYLPFTLHPILLSTLYSPSYPCIYPFLSILFLYLPFTLHRILVSTLYSPSCPCFKHLRSILSLYLPLLSILPLNKPFTLRPILYIYPLLSILPLNKPFTLHPILVSTIYSPSYPCITP